MGFLFLILYPEPPPSPPPPPPPPLLRRHFVTQQLSHTTLSHTNFVRTIFDTQLCHTNFHTFVTHNFVAQQLSHTTLSHTNFVRTIFDTQLCRTLTFTHNSVTQQSSANTTLSQAIFDHNSPPPTQLCHTPSLTQLCHTLSLSHTLCHTPTFHCHTPTFSHTIFDTQHVASLCVAGMALGDIHLRFTWQASHLETFFFVLRGRRGTWRHLWHWAGSGGALGRAWSPVTPRHFAWQAWHLATSTFVPRDRRGTWRHSPSFCVAGVALMALGRP